MSESYRKPLRYYPLFVDIEGRTCLVVGGGSVGERKVRSLLDHGARVRLVALELTPWLDSERSTGGIVLSGREYDKSHLDGVALVFSATSDQALNRRVSEDAATLGIWCNMASDPELGSLVVPSVVERGPLSIAVSTSGLSPALAKRIRIRLEEEFGSEWEFFILFLGELRKQFKFRNIEGMHSSRIFGELAAHPVPEWLKQGDGRKAFEKVSEICAPLIGADELRPVWDKLWKPFFS